MERNKIMMLIFALIGLVGIICLMISIICGLDPASENINRWIAVFVIGIFLVLVSYIGGLLIQDAEENVKSEYEYHYCPFCGAEYETNY